MCNVTSPRKAVTDTNNSIYVRFKTLKIFVVVNIVIQYPYVVMFLYAFDVEYQKFICFSVIFGSFEFKLNNYCLF